MNCVNRYSSTKILPNELKTFAIFPIFNQQGSNDKTIDQSVYRVPMIKLTIEQSAYCL